MLTTPPKKKIGREKKTEEEGESGIRRERRGDGNNRGGIAAWIPDLFRRNNRKKRDWRVGERRKFTR